MTRLQKSLSHDWIDPSKAHVFPLRKYYVQLEWNKKIRNAMGCELVTLTSIHELVREVTKKSSNVEKDTPSGLNIVIEGKGPNQGWHIGGILPIPILPIWFCHNRYICRYCYDMVMRSPWPTYRSIYLGSSAYRYRYIGFANIAYMPDICIGRYRYANRGPNFYGVLLTPLFLCSKYEKQVWSYVLKK